MKKDVVIIGAGLVGSLLGIFLVRRGYKVSIYEAKPDMRQQTAYAGRSINLALSSRGLKALNKLGLDQNILSIAIPMPGRLIHNLDGQTNFQPYGKEDEAIFSVSRRELNIRLMDIAEKEGIDFYFEKKCSRIDWEKKLVYFSDLNGEESRPVPAPLLFGADGAYAASRLQHMLQHPKFDYHQFYIDCGYKEISIPAGKDGRHLLDKNALHIWPRKEYMFIALPNLDGSFTGTLFFPFEGEKSFEKLTTPEAVTQFFREEFPGIPGMISDLNEQFFHNPTSSLVTVQCYPWIRPGHFTLVGDAAHALVPFFGQGMNCGFEDCLVLDELLDAHKDDWEMVLETFQQQRKPDADAIAEMAINNFIEMRAKTADPSFLLQKKIEARLHDQYPGEWIPAYSLVTFHPQVRYSEAKERGERQEAIMQKVMSRNDIHEKWQDASLYKEIIGMLRATSPGLLNKNQ